MAQNPEPERPLEQAMQRETLMASAHAADTQAEHEADMAIADVDAYVASTSPDTLPEAERVLEAWQIPSSPFDGLPEAGDGSIPADSSPLVSVLSAQSESEANIVRGLLESEGIAVIFREVGAPAYGSAFSVSEARWADLLVSSKEADQAKAIIAAAMQQNKETM